MKPLWPMCRCVLKGRYWIQKYDGINVKIFMTNFGTRLYAYIPHNYTHIKTEIKYPVVYPNVSIWYSVPLGITDVYVHQDKVLVSDTEAYWETFALLAYHKVYQYKLCPKVFRKFTPDFFGFDTSTNTIWVMSKEGFSFSSFYERSYY